jgi:hypothetical protein
MSCVASGTNLLRSFYLSASIHLQPMVQATTTLRGSVSKAVGLWRSFAWQLVCLPLDRPVCSYTAQDPVGPENDAHLKRLQSQAKLVVCAWSNTGSYLGRDVAVLPSLKAPHCLVKLKSGRPGHPLYKRADLRPIPL